MKKYILEIALSLGLCASLIAGAFALDTQRDISCKLIRLHIIANSDSAEDQELKLRVRDAILEKVTLLTKNCNDVADAEAVINSNLDELERIANTVISENGFDYTARAELTNAHFSTRVYDAFSLPAGEYNSLRIHLGNGSGKNWWCVLFPPVCVSAAEAKAEFSKNGFTEEELSFVTSDDPEYKFKFKLLEIIEAAAKRFSAE